MESKTKHRILGIVVVAGMAILAYPFIQGSSNISKEQVSVKAPPFPDQAIQVSTAEDAAATTPQDISSPSAAEVSVPAVTAPEQAMQPDVVNIAAPSTSAPPEVSAPLASAEPASNTVAVAAVTPDETPKQDTPAEQAAAPVAANTETPSSATPAETDKSQPDVAPSSLNSSNDAPAPAAASDETKTAPKKKVSSAKAKAHKQVTTALMSKLTTASAINANKRKPVDNNGLLKLKQAAYVIQIGSFKEKTNALRLVNKLRAQGYRAFIQHAVVASGENTRVFVGPEHHQASARVLASELENKMKLHGIVISYKPFTL